MDLERVLALLRTELKNLDAAIQSLEHLQQRARRKGRPPSWLAALEKTARPRSSKRRPSDDDNKRD